jgi:hypothetical protein
MASSELSYVQMSRHKNEAHLFIDRQNFESQLRTELYNAEPTEKMAALAEQVAAEQQIALPGEARQDFWSCREFLNEHASNELLKKEDAELLQQVSEKLGREREKESTLDYVQAPEPRQEQEREPEPQAEPELEMEMEMEM